MTKASSQAVLSPVKGRHNSNSHLMMNFSNSVQQKEGFQQTKGHHINSQSKNSPMNQNLESASKIILSNHAQMSQQTGQDFKAKKRRKFKGSFVDHILEAAHQTQQEEQKDFFLTHVQSESILPPIVLNDKTEYKSLMLRQKQVNYLVSKHVRLASERLKYGKVENNHYQHYEKLEPMESVLQKAKPSHKTLNYQPKAAALEKPSLELMKTVNKKLMKEKEENHNDPITNELISDTYQIFGMNQEDIEDVNAIIAEEDDKIEIAPREIKFTEHQHEFRNICSKVNKEKSAEIFVKSNKDFSKWNLRDKNSVTYFLSRAAQKEPRNFIEKEIQERQAQNDEFFYRKPVKITKVDNQDGLDEKINQNENIEEEQQYSDDYEYYSESAERNSVPDQFQGSYPKLLDTSRRNTDRNLLDIGENPKNQKRYASMSAGGRRRRDNSNGSQKSRQVINEEEDKMIEEEKKKEEDELKKFIFLEKLKYEKAIKGYDRMPGMKANLDEFTDVLMQKLFKKREPTNEFKFIIKKDNTHQRIDHSKPLYLDDLKRFGKLKDIGGKKKYTLIEHPVSDLKREFQDINIFNMDQEEFQDGERLQKSIKNSQQKQIQQSLTQEKKPSYSGAWYLPVKKWGNIQKYNHESKEAFQQKNEQNDKDNQIGELTKQALKYILNPFKEDFQVKRVKLVNKVDQINIQPKEKHYVEQKDIKDNSELDILLQNQLNFPFYKNTHSNATSFKQKITDNFCEDQEDDELLTITNKNDKELFNKLKQFILPSQHRLSLIEWLLETYEPGILQSEEIKSMKESSKVEQLEMLFRQIGIINFSDKRGGTQNQLDKSIEGLNGTLDSLQLLVRLAKFVISSQQMESIDNRNFQSMNDKLMNYICTNQKQIFQPTVRLFPPGFPKSELFNQNDHESNMDQLSLIVDDLSYKVEYMKKKIGDLNAKSLQHNQDQIKLANQEDLKELQISLQNFKILVTQFNDVFEDSMKRDLSRVAQNQIQTQLGQVVEQTAQDYQDFDKVTSEFHGIIEKLGRLQIKLQMIGLNEKNNYKREDEQITNECPSQSQQNGYQTFTYDPNSPVFIDQEHDKYANTPLNALQVDYDANDQDQLVLFNLYTGIVEKKLDNFTVKTAFDSAIELGNKIATRSSNFKECKAKFTKGSSGLDTANMNFQPILADRYLMIPYKGYYQNPGLVQIAYIMKNYSHKLGGLMKPFQQIEFGYKWGYDKNDSQYYFIQEFKPFSQYKIRTLWTQADYGRVVESNVYESQWKSSLRFIYDLNQNQTRTEMFKHSFADDPEKNIYIKLGKKNRSNKVDTNHSSRVLMENALGGDNLYVARLGLRFNEVYDTMLLTNCLSMRASTEVASNFEDTKFMRAKFFTRYIFAYQQALFQTSLSMGYLKALQGSRQPKCNDNFYLRNFKGVRNIGYHYDQSNPVKGISGENLGFDKFVNLNLKISQLEMPLLQEVGIKPFININAAIAPNKYLQGAVQRENNIKTFLRDYGRASIGLGLSLQLPSVAIECYFNPLIYRQKNELKADFQINIGID